ncbi:MAG: hypothetical protein GY868_05260 [Deltaproteobacteria bacterium]|nr:hypothetical protein [Deltaproteobacteria bacterium]
MKNLAPPTQDLIARIESEVDYEQRLVAASLHGRSGIKNRSLYSLAEVFGLLSGPLPQIDLRELSEWVRSVIRDTELADRIAGDSAQAQDAMDAILCARNLVGARLLQCKEISPES